VNGDLDIESLYRGPVLVTGATGFLGSALVRHLRRAHVPVRALVRSHAKAQYLSTQGVQTVVGDVTDEDALADALRDVAVVFHLAGKLYEPWASPNEYHVTHVEGTKILLDTARRQTALERFVHCSTTGVLGVTGDRPADESTPMRPTNVYEATKAEAELAVSAACDEGFPAVVVRPGLVYGPGDLHLLGFFRSVLNRQFRPIGGRPVWLHPIYIDDMTEAFVRCAVHPRAVGECFNLAGPEPVPLDRLAAAIADAAGTKPAVGRIPLAVARAAAAVGDALPPRLRSRAPLTRSRLDFLTHSRLYSVAKAEASVGFDPATDLTTGIKHSIAWYREHGYLAA
jgi:nucleoside-diphosphate-sugar epimerase